MASKKDILYIKHVKRDKGYAWAYMEYKVGDEFELRFPNNHKWFPTNYSRPKPGELIVLFQRIETTQIAPYRGAYITHLVTPVNEIVEKDNHAKHPYKRLVRVIATKDDYRIDENLWSMFKPNRGQVCNIYKVEKKKGVDATMDEKQDFIWSIFH